MDYEEFDAAGSDNEEKGEKNGDSPDTKEADKEEEKANAIAAKADAQKNKPKTLTKSKFKFGYIQTIRISCVLITPFKPEFFHNETFVTYFNMAKHWIMKKRAFLERSESGILLQLRTAAEGDDCWDELKTEFADMEGVVVEHPVFTQASQDANFWGDQGIVFMKDWILNLGVLKPRQVQDSFMQRVISVEGVPDGVTQAELIEQFPEALNVIDFSYDAESTGFAGIEMSSEQACRELIKKHRNLSIKDTPVKLHMGQDRFEHFDFLLKKWLRTFPDIEMEELSDKERQAMVAEFMKLKAERQEAEEGRTYMGMERLKKTHEVNLVMFPMTRHLFSDTCIRMEKGKPIPETSEQQPFMVACLVKGTKDAKLRAEKDRRRRMHAANRKRRGVDGATDDEPSKKRFDGGNRNRGGGGGGRHGGRGRFSGGRDRFSGGPQMMPPRSLLDEDMSFGSGYGSMGPGMGGGNRMMNSGGNRMMGGFMQQGFGGMQQGMGGGEFGSGINMTVANLQNKIRELEQLAHNQHDSGYGGGGNRNFGRGGSYGNNRW